MKKVLKFGVYTMLSLLVISACKKKSNTNTTSTSTSSSINGSITAVVQGANWTSIRNSASLIIDNTNGYSGIVINAETNADLMAIGIDIAGTSSLIATGAHDTNGPIDDLVITYSTKNSNGGLFTEHFPVTASLNITSVDNVNHKFSGNFNYVMHKVNSQTAADTLIVKNGVFTDIAFGIQQR